MAEYKSREYRDEPVHTSAPTRKVTPEEVAYRDGYVHGRAVENHVRDPLQTIHRQQDIARQQDLNRKEQRLRTEADNYIASGLVLGLFISLLAGLIGGLMYFLTRENQNEVILETPTQEVVPVPVETQVPAIPEASTPNVEVIVPAPQNTSPDAENATNQDVNEVPTNGTTTNSAGAGTATTEATRDDATENSSPSSIDAITVPPQSSVPLGVQQVPQGSAESDGELSESAQ